MPYIIIFSEVTIHFRQIMSSMLLFTTSLGQTTLKTHVRERTVTWAYRFIDTQTIRLLKMVILKGP
ncbi:hypothetical protein EGY12_04895 [Serratia sp. FDAARGOS_506]|nr:hypothetical protein EGY12_04895 [Serratia sp. FDAARGOS_506]